MSDITDDLITYRRLWLDLKGELDRESVVHYGIRGPFTSEESARISRRFLDRMEQAETLAFYAHVPPATRETWESVREGLRVKG